MLKFIYLSVKWIIMQKVCAVKLLAVSLIQCYHILPTVEYLNLLKDSLKGFLYKLY